MTKDNFHKFLNADQRDPRLNEILHPYVTKEHASKLISRHEKGRRGGEGVAWCLVHTVIHKLLYFSDNIFSPASRSVDVKRSSRLSPL